MVCFFEENTYSAFTNALKVAVLSGIWLKQLHDFARHKFPSLDTVAW